MTDTTKLVLLIFLSIDFLVLFGLIVSIIYKAVRRRQVLHFGDRAEETVSETLKREFPGGVVLNNVYLKNGKGTTQLDHILICKWGLFVIETKSHNGRIQIENKEWIQFYKEKIVRFRSPLLQNESHVRALNHVLKRHRALQRVKAKGLVVFTSKRVHFSKRLEGVLLLEELSPYVKSGGKTKSRRATLTGSPGKGYFSRQKIALIERQIRKYSLSGQRSRKEHSRKLQSLDRRHY